MVVYVIVDVIGDLVIVLFFVVVVEVNGWVFVFVEVFEGGIGVLIVICVLLCDFFFVEGCVIFFVWCDV